jgi:hypothetical protein
MNQQERDDLREKHTSITFQPADYPQHPVCIVCDSAYPCDTIVVLDWAEFLLGELKSISAVWDGE